MDILTVIIAVIVLGLIGVVVYLMVDYFKHKDEVDKGFVAADKQLGVEANTRKSNVAFVVDKVNTVSSGLTKEIVATNAKVTAVDDRASKLINNMDQWVRFTGGGVGSSNVGAGVGAGTIGIMDMPGMSKPDINLMNRVNMVGGMTAQTMGIGGAGGKSATFCNGERCIKFPDESGNTYLTTMTEGKDIVMDGRLVTKKDLHMTSASGPGNAQIKVGPDGEGMGFFINNQIAGVLAPDAFLAENVIANNMIEAPFISTNGIVLASYKTTPIIISTDLETGALTITGNVIVKGTITSTAPAGNTIGTGTTGTGTTGTGTTGTGTGTGTTGTGTTGTGTGTGTGTAIITPLL